MGENSAIEWCEHSFNPWRGCTHVSPGCEHCYAETLSASAGAMSIPPSFTLALRPFEGSPPHEIVARLRYRLREGAIKLGFVLDRPDELLRAAFEAAAAEVEVRTNLPVWFGAPRAS